jgi:hypothetical protein
MILVNPKWQSDNHIKCSWELCMDMSWFVVFAMLSHGFCHNFNIGFATKCKVQGSVVENAKDET